jgi:hypothetical protein
MYEAIIKENGMISIYHVGTKMEVVEVDTESKMYDYLQILNNRGISEFWDYLENNK